MYNFWNPFDNNNNNNNNNNPQYSSISSAQNSDDQEAANLEILQSLQRENARLRDIIRMQEQPSATYEPSFPPEPQYAPRFFGHELSEYKLQSGVSTVGNDSGSGGSNEQDIYQQHHTHLLQQQHEKQVSLQQHLLMIQRRLDEQQDMLRMQQEEEEQKQQEMIRQHQLKMRQQQNNASEDDEEMGPLVAIPTYGQYHLVDGRPATYKAEQKHKQLPAETRKKLMQMNGQFHQFREKFWGNASASAAAALASTTSGDSKSVGSNSRRRQSTTITTSLTSSGGSGSGSGSGSNDASGQQGSSGQHFNAWPSVIASDWVDNREVREQEMIDEARRVARVKAEEDYYKKNEELEADRLKHQYDIMKEAVQIYPNKSIKKWDKRDEIGKKRRGLITPGNQPWPMALAENLLQDVDDQKTKIEKEHFEGLRAERQALARKHRKPIPPPTYFEIPWDRAAWPLDVAEFELKGGKDKYPNPPDTAGYKGTKPILTPQQAGVFRKLSKN